MRGSVDLHQELACGDAFPLAKMVQMRRSLICILVLFSGMRKVRQGWQKCRYGPEGFVCKPGPLATMLTPMLLAVLSSFS